MAAIPPRLPFRGAHGAPQFDGTPTHLNRYFSDIDQIYSALGMTPSDQDRITQTLYYLDADTSSLWETLNPPAGQQWTWDTFKAAVRVLYPGSEGGRLFSVTDLERFVADSAVKGVFTRADLGEYFRQFTRITKHLLASNRIDNNSIDRFYIQGFGEITCRKIETRLVITQQNHHPDDPYPMIIVHQAAEFLLSSTSPVSNAQSSNPITPSPSASFTVPGIPSAPDTQVKREIVDISNLGGILLSMQNSITQLAQAMANNTLNQQQNRGNRPPQSQSNNCLMCGKSGCWIRDCALVEEYRKAGKCIRNGEGRVCLPSGNFVPSHFTGNTLAERIDKWHAANPGHLAITQTVIPTVTTAVFDSVESLSYESLFTEGSVQESEDLPMDQDEINRLAQILATEMAKKGPPRGKKPEVVITKPAPKPKPAPAVSQPVRAPPPCKDPQFHFQSPCENPAITQQIIDRALDAQFTISQRELLAVSPDIRRKMYHRKARTRRIPRRHLQH
jgi:hypothetical protein